MQKREYYELKISINPEASEIVSNICFENFDCEGVVSCEETYEGLAEDSKLVSTTSEKIKAFLREEPQNVEEVLTQQRKLLLQRGFSEDELGCWDFSISKKQNEDWSKKWKENWDVTHLSEKIAVVPSWLEYEKKPDETIIKLDPGSAFGTGTHPTTKLCMLALEKHLKQDDALADIGTGSGILAICGILLGAKNSYACDNDKTVIQTAKENAQMNSVNEKITFEHNTVDKVAAKYDFVTANILHFVLAEIMPDLKRIMKDNAKLILSGIMQDKKQVVLDAISKNDLKITQTLSEGDWVAFVVEKN